MRIKRNLIQILLLLAAILPTAVKAQLTYVTNKGAITITGYIGTLTSLNIPSTTNGLPVTSIGNVAFSDQFYVTNVTIPNGITNIGVGAFLACDSLTSVTVPASVTSIGLDAFAHCYSLAAITVDSSNPAYSSVNGVLFNKNQTTLLQYPGAGDPLYTIPNSVTSIGSTAFESCWSLIAVTIPNSVTSIGSYAFAFCQQLTSAYFQGNAPSVDSTVFTNELVTNMTVFYPVGGTGWGSTFGSVPAAANVAVANAVDVDAILNHTPTAEEIQFVDSEIQIDTSQIDGLGSLPYSPLIATAAGGYFGPITSVPVSTVKNRLYNLMLIMNQLSFSRSLPWTNSTLNQWFVSSCHKITIVTNGLSEANPAYQQIIISAPTNSNLLLTGKWSDPELSGNGLVNTMAVMIHEARHLNGYFHTAGTKDATLNELGAWAAENYFYRLVADYSNVTNSIEHYTSNELRYDASRLLALDIVNPKLGVTLNDFTMLNNNAVISIISPQPYSPHQLQESTDLKNWNVVGTASFTNTTGSNVLATTSITRSNDFYRVLLQGL